MSKPDQNQEAPRARVERHRAIGWIWTVPLAAVLIVAWLAWNELSTAGPTITITFQTADGVEAGTTKIRHNSVEIGTVKRVSLIHDLTRVVVTANMSRQISDHLNTGTRFWVVRPRFTVGGVSGLETIVSGAYIEMEPAKGNRNAVRHFIGLETPPVVQAEVPGKTFRLRAHQIRSLNQGSPVYYRGISVGQVTGFDVAASGAWVNIHILIKAPYVKLVHPESLFWNVSAVAISAGTGGLKATAASLETLLAGGIGFDTPDEALNSAPSPPGKEFRLYDDEAAARSQLVGPRAYYTVQFPGGIRDLDVGAPVELQGVSVGRVSEMHLEYDPRTHVLWTPVTIALQSKQIVGIVPQDNNLQETMDQTLDHLIEQGLRARLANANLLSGQRLVSLEFDSRPSAAHLIQGRLHMAIPTVSSGDFDDLSRSAAEVANNLNQLVTSPEMKRSIRSLDETLANLDHVSHEASGQVGPLIASLRRAADSTQSALATANRSMGGQSAQNADLPRLISELTDAARSVRALADYLDEHPEALVRGRVTDER
jgi:paraquat-inducible protein B